MRASGLIGLAFATCFFRQEDSKGLRTWCPARDGTS